jgi:SAM-dependent methyltransferase
VPGVASENYWFRRHLAAYRHLADEVDAATMIEIGAGEGYGATLFAERSEMVVALDYDAAAVEHLAASYPHLHAVRGNLAALPFASQVAATVGCLQVIEHVWDHPQFVRECARVLQPGGQLIISTPNRLTFSPGLDKPVNPFHTHEFTAWELSSLIAHNGLAVFAVRGLMAGAKLAELDVRYQRMGYASFVAAQLATPPEAWSTQLAFDVASIATEDFMVADVATDDCLDLIVLARRP